MKIFTISNGSVSNGATVETMHLKGADIDIPAIIVGEEGRGRKRGVLPVRLQTESFKKHQEDGQTEIYFGKMTTTKSGKPKIEEIASSDLTDKCICVFRTMYGFRGTCYHTGDFTGEYKKDWRDKDVPVYKDFPGEIIVSGVVAEGAAGRMANGEQIIAIMPKDIIFRTGYSGRLYGKPSEHYYKFDGKKIISLSGEEREVADLF